MEHTKGPWSHKEYKNGYAILNDEDKYVADVHQWTGKDANASMSLANARLISAAPEMLEALELAQNILMNAGQKPVKGNNLFIISSAINRAKGL